MKKLSKKNLFARPAAGGAKKKSSVPPWRDPALPRAERMSFFKKRAQKKPVKKIASWKKTYWKIIGLILITESLLLSFGVLSNFKNVFGQKLPIASNKVKIENVKIDPQLTKQTQEEIPTRIIIPKLLDLPIEKGEIDNGFWTIPEKLPAFLIGSTPPGKIGNTVIYGHAKEEVFGPLKDVKQNDSIYLLTESKWHRYKVLKIKTINPEEVEIIYPTSKITLTLYTCTAFLDSKRLIIQAQQETSSKI